MQTRRYLVIIEGAEGSYSAYAPDVLGCVAAGQMRAEVGQLMQEALEFHFERMAKDGDTLPEQHSVAIEVDIPLPATRVA